MISLVHFLELMMLERREKEDALNEISFYKARA